MPTTINVSKERAMADNETKPSANDGREELVAKQLASTKIHLALA